MKTEALPTALPDPSKRQLLGAVPASFMLFYRHQLRFRSGSRIKTKIVADLYRAWAELNGSPSMDSKAIKRAMQNIGHTYFTSNGSYFGNVQLAATAPELTDNFPEGPPLAEPRRSLLARIDRISIDLDRLRRDLTLGWI